jgi:hypothetical protein
VLIGIGTVKMQPVGQAIIGNSSRRVLADVDYQRLPPRCALVPAALASR